MDPPRLADFSGRMRYARTAEDFDHLTTEPGELARLRPDDPDVLALGDQLATVRRIWAARGA